MWAVILIAVSVFVWSYRNEKAKRKDNQAEVGAEKIMDGYYWWNVGDLYDNENWVRMGPIDPVYYVKLTSDQQRENFRISIRCEPVENPNTYYSCHSAYEVDCVVRFLKAEYEVYGNVVVDGEYQRILEKTCDRHGNYG
ncbi:hypothetical protein CR194_04950 [Salipaludibacillus keqinensis]|uniref:Uncharacterized protein n=1 Tax=Salipaludibacillus keqinensis TaxID=2045207 RepID=A0A323TLC4_9BACI|nr:hypothetical protein [Salipaludibacillus keqinensis]PYZ94876.1 hypothetical protein CR194_04950 [Salipaludibacillus keqinensis]